MDILIDREGYLFIWRADKWKQQRCPKTNKECCGDWCPLFEEPDRGRDVLKICHTSLKTKKVRDERICLK